MTIDNNTPILNSVGYTLTDLNNFKDALPVPPEPVPDPEITKEKLDAIRDEYIAKKGHVSVIKLAQDNGLTVKQIKDIKKEIDYALSKYGGQ